jgi:hemolysin activation/secretion protein
MKRTMGPGLGLLVCLISAASMAQSARFTISGFDVQGNTLLPEGRVQAIVSAFAGLDKDIDDINEAAQALRKAYENAGYPVVKVFPPPQAAGSGRIVLKVIEGQVDIVRVRGNNAYGEANIRASLPTLQEKTKPNVKEIVASIAAANENPAKQVAVNFQAAEQLGNIDAVVNVTEDQPKKTTLNLDNTGNKASGVYRATLGYQHANLFDRDHMLTLQVGTAIDKPNTGFQVSGGYRVPFYGSGLTLDAIAAYSRSTTTTRVGFGSTDMNGRGTVLGVRLNQSLPSLGEYRHRLIYGFDYKDFDNTCTGINAGTCGTVTSQPVSVTYFATRTTPEYQASAALAYAVNVPGGSHGSRVEYALARGQADQAWSALRGNASLAIPLPQDMQLRASLAGQYSPSRLIPAEQFGIGGAASVRGYAERSATSDRGWAASLELYSPDYGRRFAEDLSLRGLLFFDVGYVNPTDPIRTLAERSTRLHSVGLGVRAQRGRDLSLKADLGVALKDFAGTAGAGNSRTAGDTFVHVAANLQF